jgi:hypothetical protein
MLGEIEEDRLGVVLTVDEKLEVIWVLAGGGFPEVLVSIEIEQDSSFLALGISEELDSGKVEADFVGVATSAYGLAKVIFG